MANAKRSDNKGHSAKVPSKAPHPEAPSPGKLLPALAVAVGVVVGFAFGLLLGLVIGEFESGPSPEQVKQLNTQSNKLVELSGQVADLKATNERLSRVRAGLGVEGNLNEQAGQLAEVTDSLAELKAMSEELSRTWMEDTPKKTRPRGRMPPQPERNTSQPNPAGPQRAASRPKNVRPPTPKVRQFSREYPIRRTRVGDVRIRVMEVIVGHVPVRDAALGEEKKTAEKYLTIWLQLENAGRAQTLPYHSLSGKSARDTTAFWTDEDGKVYEPVGPRLDLPVSGTKLSASIFPLKTITEALVFELPARGTENLQLILPAKAFGGTGRVSFEIPMSMATVE